MSPLCVPSNIGISLESVPVRHWSVDFHGLAELDLFLESLD